MPTVKSSTAHLTPGDDDGIVVEGRCRMTADEYLYDTDETNQSRELSHGMVREPPAPFFSHQSLVLKIARVWSDHVEPRALGRVAIAPLDVVLDRERALILQPDVLFIRTDRFSIIRDQVWGAPDLVAEVLSHSTENRDRGEKLEWYRQYGVRECWLVDLYGDCVTVVDFTGPAPEKRVAFGPYPIRSTVLPDLELSTFGLFA
jgi:Uma2 family endonuclease